jgi:hypothetical protein
MLKNFSHNIVDHQSVMTRQEFRTAQSRLSDAKFMPTKRVIGTPSRDAGFKVLHMKLASSFFYANSYPSSQNQKRFGIVMLFLFIILCFPLFV